MQALCDDCENGVKGLNEAAAKKFADEWPHLRKAINALKDKATSAQAQREK